MVMYKIDRRGGGPKNRSLGNYPLFFIREALLSLFSGICSVENLILVPQKSYAFLVFTSLHDAQELYIIIFSVFFSA